MKNVIFLAPPAAGKGTFSDYLVKNFGYAHYSTGDILRERAKSDTELAELLRSGGLVNDDEMMRLIEDVLKNHDQNVPFILDGIPRTLQQAKKLDIILNSLGIIDIVAVYIDVDKDILVDRVVGRRICPQCHRSYNVKLEGFQPLEEGICDDCKTPLIHREDDNLESFLKRYQAFIESTYPIVSYYKEKGSLKVVSNNELSQTSTFENLRGVVK